MSSAVVSPTWRPVEFVWLFIVPLDSLWFVPDVVPLFLVVPSFAVVDVPLFVVVLLSVLVSVALSEEFPVFVDVFSDVSLPAFVETVVPSALSVVVPVLAVVELSVTLVVVLDEFVEWPVWEVVLVLSVTDLFLERC